MFDAISFYKDHGIDFVQEGHKHCRPGWVQVECPFCAGNAGYHLGYNLEEGWYACWRCGGHSIVEVVATLAHVPYGKAKTISKSYKTRGKLRRAASSDEDVKIYKRVVLPEGSIPITQSRLHCKYLSKRRFDPFKLQDEWDLHATTFAGEYRWRIVAPIYFNKRLVSYQCRDVSGNSSLKYMACRKEDEAIHHKHILYGIDKTPRERIVVVEGITDVWRLGAGAVATFGIKFKPQQVKLLSEFPQVFVLFDMDEVENPESAKKARELAAALSNTGVSVELIQLDHGDPADLSDEEAQQLMKELGF